MAPTIIYAAPTFATIRSEAGAIAADPATINDTNYPMTKALQPPAGGAGLVVYWYAGGGTVHAEDYLDLQLLYRDAKNPVAAKWVEGPTRYGVRQNAQVAFPTKGSSQCYVRVVGIRCAAGTTLQIQAAAEAR